MSGSIAMLEEYLKASFEEKIAGSKLEIQQLEMKLDKAKKIKFERSSSISNIVINKANHWFNNFNYTQSNNQHHGFEDVDLIVLESTNLNDNDLSRQIESLENYIKKNEENVKKHEIALKQSASNILDNASIIEKELLSNKTKISFLNRENINTFFLAHNTYIRLRDYFIQQKSFDQNSENLYKLKNASNGLFVKIMDDKNLPAEYQPLKLVYMCAPPEELHRLMDGYYEVEVSRKEFVRDLQAEELNDDRIKALQQKYLYPGLWSHLDPGTHLTSEQIDNIVNYRFLNREEYLEDLVSSAKELTNKQAIEELNKKTKFNDLDEDIKQILIEQRAYSITLLIYSNFVSYDENRKLKQEARRIALQVKRNVRNAILNNLDKKQIDADKEKIKQNLQQKEKDEKMNIALESLRDPNAKIIASTGAVALYGAMLAGAPILGAASLATAVTAGTIAYKSKMDHDNLTIEHIQEESILHDKLNPYDYHYIHELDDLFDNKPKKKPSQKIGEKSFDVMSTVLEASKGAADYITSKAVSKGIEEVDKKYGKTIEKVDRLANTGNKTLNTASKPVKSAFNLVSYIFYFPFKRIMHNYKHERRLSNLFILLGGAAFAAGIVMATLMLATLPISMPVVISLAVVAGIFGAYLGLNLCATIDKNILTPIFGYKNIVDKNFTKEQVKTMNNIHHDLADTLYDHIKYRHNELCQSLEKTKAIKGDENYKKELISKIKNEITELESDWKNLLKIVDSKGEFISKLELYINKAYQQERDRFVNSEAESTKVINLGLEKNQLMFNKHGSTVDASKINIGDTKFLKNDFSKRYERLDTLKNLKEICTEVKSTIKNN